jgi:predicted nucleic acid-binding protein
VAYRAIVDSNVLVYCFDARHPKRMTKAWDVLTRGAADGTLALCHQSVIEFVEAVSKPRVDGRPIVPPGDLAREVEELLVALPVLYPTESVLRNALRARATYQLSWFDAHLLSYAESYGVPEVLSEDFQHGRSYGRVRVVNPFIELIEPEDPGGQAKA